MYFLFVLQIASHQQIWACGDINLSITVTDFFASSDEKNITGEMELSTFTTWTENDSSIEQVLSHPTPLPSWLSITDNQGDAWMNITGCIEEDKLALSNSSITNGSYVGIPNPCLNMTSNATSGQSGMMSSTGIVHLSEAVNTITIILSSLSPVINATGIAGNLLTILVMMLPHNRKKSYAIYMMFLAVSDFLVTVDTAFFTLSSRLILPIPGHVSCLLIMYVTFSSNCSSSGMLLLCTIDRFIAIRFPFKHLTLGSSKRALLSTALVYLFMWTFNIPHFWTTDTSTSCFVFGTRCE